MLLLSLLHDVFLTTSPTNSLRQETPPSLVKALGSFTVNEVVLKMLSASGQMVVGTHQVLLLGCLPQISK